MIRSRLLAVAIAMSGLMTAWALTAEAKLGYPLHLVQQGVTKMRLPVQTPDEVYVRDVYVIRDGSQITVFDPFAPGTETRLVWCPREEFFVSPSDASLFDRSGRYVDGPATGDMAQYLVSISTETLELELGPKRQRPKTTGEVSGDAAERYRNWKADPATPQRFCQDPVT